MFGSDVKAKKFLVVKHIHYDWNLYSDDVVGDFNTIEGAQEFIDGSKLATEGLSQNLHVYEKKETR